MEFFATSQGIPVRISDSKEGKSVLVFLHGYLETLDVWEEFVATVPKEFRTVAIDLPGQGLTGTLPETNELDFSARVVNGVLELLQIESAILVGHSMGGYVAQSFLEQFPDKTRALIHLNSNPYADAPEKLADRQREIELIRQGKLLTLASVAIPNMYAPQNVRRMEDAIMMTVELCDMHDPDGICATILGLTTRKDQVALLQQTDKPVLFVLGESDNFLSPEKRDQMRKDLQAIECVILPNTGHNSFLEDPGATWQAMASFIQKNGLL